MFMYCQATEMVDKSIIEKQPQTVQENKIRMNANEQQEKIMCLTRISDVKVKPSKNVHETVCEPRLMDGA